MKKKKPTHSSLKKKLDKIFSVYIRLRDCTNGEYVSCITCGKSTHWRDCDAGHFRSRRHASTRWDEQNVHAQCKYCNNWGSGMSWEHGNAIDQKYGDGTALNLKHLSHESFKYSIGELQEMIENYEALVQKLAKEKGIQL